MRDNYLNELTFNSTIQNFLFNKINTLDFLNFNFFSEIQIPGIIGIINGIKNYNNILIRYKYNENKLRIYIKEDDVSSILKDYEDTLNRLNNELSEKIFELNCYANDEFEKKEFIELFLEDYYTKFLCSKELNDSELRKILKQLVKLKMNNQKEKNDLGKIGEIILWVECYSDEIFCILRNINDNKNYIDKIYEQIENIFLNDYLKYENIYDFKGYTRIVNETLFFGFESILKIFLINDKIYLNLLNKPIFSNFIKSIKSILNNIKYYYTKLKLGSKFIFSLKEILFIIKKFVSNNICTEKNLGKLLKYFINEPDNEKDFEKNFETFINDLNNLLGKDQNYYSLLSLVYKNESCLQSIR